jgi:5-methylthioadenosine/S-adenosylhomocysteine deaminase
LKCGVTTGVSLLGGGNNVMRMDGPGCAEAHIDAIVSVGVRDVLAVGPMHPPHPTEFTRWIEGAPVQVAVSFDAQIETSATLIDRWHGRHESRTLVALLYPTVRPEHRAGATSETLTLMAEQAKATWALSRSRDVVFMQDGHTRGTVSYHHDMGIIGPNTLLSHATDITDKEVAICAETGCSIAHNPSAFASIYGRCPVPELMTAGVNVALGSDAAAPDRSHDMFRHMVHCLHYHRRHARDHRALAPGQVLEMATINAACALGLENETGSLEVGKKADVILVDLAKPHLAPMNMPHYRVVCFANGADVDTVIVGGKVLMSGRSVLSVAEDAVLAEAERATELFLKRTGFHAMTDVRPDFFGR